MGTSLVTPGVTVPPADYAVDSILDLKEDRRAAVTIQVGFAAVVGVMVALAVLLDLPLDSSWSGWVVAGVTVAACLLFMVLHELTHGLVLWVLTRVPPTYAVRLPYLVTGSQALLRRREAVAVALAPLLLWGAVLLVLLSVVPADLFLTVYVLLALNVAAASGDVLQAWVFGRLPQGALVRDDGRQTTVYLPA